MEVGVDHLAERPGAKCPDPGRVALLILAGKRMGNNERWRCRPERGRKLGNPGIERAVLSRVGVDSDDGRGGVGEVGAGFLQPLRVPVDEHDMGARLRPTACNGCPEMARAAGDDDGLDVCHRQVRGLQFFEVRYGGELAYQLKAARKRHAGILPANHGRRFGQRTGQGHGRKDNSVVGRELQ